MWILPKQLHTLACVPGTEALILDSSEFCQLCEQSLMWRSKPFPSTTWSRRLKRVGWMSLLFGRTLKPSHGEAFTKKWTSSLEASLVNPLACPESVEATKTLDTCGLTLSKELNNWDDLPLFFLRTSKALSQANSNQQTGLIQNQLLFCYMCSESWSVWVMRQRQAYSRRKKLAHLIREREFSYSVKLKAAKRSVIIKDLHSLLSMFQSEEHTKGFTNPVGRWRTPTASEGDKASSNTRKVTQRGLNNDPFLRWYTPIALDATRINLSADQKPRRCGKKRDTLPQQALREVNFTGSLNPRWVELLMGLPVYWTSPDAQQIIQIELTR